MAPPKVIIDCVGVRNEDEFWQRYLDATDLGECKTFGRNLDAFWDAIEGGGPGCPGEVHLELVNARALLPLQAGRFLEALEAIASDATVARLSIVL